MFQIQAAKRYNLRFGPGIPLMLFPVTPSPCHPMHSARWPGLDVWVKRDDMLHAQVSGNKFRKLKYPLLSLQGRRPMLVSMGGAWSNHLHALAHAAALLDMPTLALVRGPELVTACLDDCRQLGMEIRFVSREEFRLLRQDSRHWASYAEQSEAFWLPEGGSAPLALRGVAELVDELPFVPDRILTAVGTGATLAGLLAGMRGRGEVIGVAALKNADYLRGEIADLLTQAGYPAYDNYQLLTDRHCGGYGKAPPALLQFCRELKVETSMSVEPVYTGKLFYALQQMAQEGRFVPGEKIVALHTGGLQGARGFVF